MIRDFLRVGVCVVIGGATLSGCVAASTATPTTAVPTLPTLTETPTVLAVTQTPTTHQTESPTLTSMVTTSVYTPAPETRVASADVPDGEYLFLEYWDDTRDSSWDDAHVDYPCPLPLLDFPGYSYASGVLGGYGGEVGEVYQMDEALPVLGFAGFGMSLGGIHSYLTAIQSVPFTSLFNFSSLPVFEERPTTPEQRQMTLFSIDREGSVIIEVGDAWIALGPGQEWYLVERYDVSPDCEVESTLTIHNYGLLEQRQLRLNFAPSE